MNYDLKCNQCGGDLLELKNSTDTYICTHCGNKMIIKQEKHEPIINVYGNVNNYYNSPNDAKIETAISPDEAIKKSKELIKTRNWQILYKESIKFTELYPELSYCWFALCKSILNLEEHPHILEFPNHFQNIILLEHEEDTKKQFINELKIDYIQFIKQKDRKLNTYGNKLFYLKNLEIYLNNYLSCFEKNNSYILWIRCKVNLLKIFKFPSYFVPKFKSIKNDLKSAVSLEKRQKINASRKKYYLLCNVKYACLTLLMILVIAWPFAHIYYPYSAKFFGVKFSKLDFVFFPVICFFTTICCILHSAIKHLNTD